MIVGAAALPPPVPTATTVSTDAAQLPSRVLDAAHAHTPLLSWWVPVAIGVLTVAAVAGALVWRHQRGRHARWDLAALGVSGLAGVTLAVAAGVNVYAGYFPTLTSVRQAVFGGTPETPGAVGALPAPAPQPQGRMVFGSPVATSGHPNGLDGSPVSSRWRLRDLRLSDPALRISGRRVIVALPPGYGTPGVTYPTLSLLNGYPGRAADWVDAGRVLPTLDAMVTSQLSPYYVVVMPDVNGGFLTDSEGLDQVDGPQVQTWLTTDVVSYVDSHFATRTDRAERVIGGMSSGGYEALNLALRHQDTYGVCLAFEPYGDPGNVTKRLLGGSVDLLHANSPSWYVPDLPLHRVIRIFVDAPSGHDAPRAQALANLIAARHEPVAFRVEAGQGHTWSEAAAGLPYALEWADRVLGGAELDATYPAADFPAGHRNGLSLILSPDAERLTQARLTCEKQVRTPAGPQHTLDVVACIDKLLHPGASPAPVSAAPSGVPVSPAA